MRNRLNVCFMLGFFLYAGLATAGTTGKIAGEVIDQDTRLPLVGVNLMIEGSMMGAAAGPEGFYNILNVPPGVYSVRASMMGYKPVVMQNVRVSIDQTTRLDFELPPTVLETDEAVTIVAERPLVRKDMTSSLASVGADEIENLPVQSVADVLELQAGVVRSGSDLHIRGGRAGEVAYWVDGVATTDVFSGASGITVENSAVQELQVVSGTFNAEYGQAMSGIINVITKEGGSDYTGQIKLYGGDYISGRDEFSVLESVLLHQDMETGSVLSTTENYTNPLSSFNPIINAQFNLSGPVPFLGDKLSFFVNGRYFRNEGYLYGNSWFTPQGLPGDSSIVPMNPFERTSLQAKLTYRPKPGMKLNYNVFWSESKQERTYSRLYKYNPDGRPSRHTDSQTHILAFSHAISKNTFYEVKLNRFGNNINRFVYENPLAKSKYLVYVPEDTANGIAEHTFDPSTDTGRQELEQIKADRLSYRYIIDPTGPMGYVHPDSTFSPASYSFLNAGMDMTQLKRSTEYWLGKFDITSQVNQYHQVKAGAELRLYELNYDWFDIKPALAENGTEQIVPFEPYVPPTSTIYHNQYLHEPRSFSAYLQDKIELTELIINIGVRFDWFDANASVPSDPTDPNIYNPFRDENIYRNPDAPEGEREEYSTDERREFMHTPVDAKLQLSPRLGIAYPITDRGVIHFSYGHFFQIPEFQYLYQNPGFKVLGSSGFSVFGNPDLKPQSTVMYEIGLQQQITDNMGIDVTLFYRDVRDWVGTSPLVSTVIDAVKYSMYENKDYSNVRGVNIKLERRFADNFSSRVSYSYQVAEGTYSNPTDAFNSYLNDEEPRLALVPLNWDQNHTVNASFVYQYKGWMASLIGRYWSGRPYTPSFPRGEFVGGTALLGLEENSARRPNRKSVDLTVNRRFQVGSLGVNLFCNAYNLLDTKNETGVYSDTGTADYTTTINRDIIQYNPARVGTVDEFIIQPGWYSAPREIHLGLSIDF